MYALIDANNFYASCERVFRPDLCAKPVLVLSNNDGCVIARSQEVKDLGIQMGQPFFQCKDLVKKHAIQVFSSNFALYGSLSNRLMAYLQTLSPDLEIYSIDECFLYFHHSEHELFSIAKTARQYAQKALGLPISIGFGRTKTLAKLANSEAKKSKTGIYYLFPDREDYLLKKTPIQSIWGIGRGRYNRLQSMGIRTAYDFKCAADDSVKATLHTPGAQTQKELQGYPCLDINSISSPKKSIVSSRSFGKKLRHFDDINAALIQNLSTALEKLRRDNQYCQTLYIFIQSSRHHHPYYKNSIGITLTEASDDTITWSHAIKPALKKIYKAGVLYAKSGVLLVELQSNTLQQGHLFSPLPRRPQLMKTLDHINHKWGKGSLISASLSPKTRPWKMNQSKKSPRYTSQWDELAVVKIA